MNLKSQRVFFNLCFSISLAFNPVHARELISGSDSLVSDNFTTNRLLDFPVLTNLATNPAMAGRSGHHSINSNYNAQWLNQVNNPKEFFISYDVALGKKKVFSLGGTYSNRSFYLQKLQSFELITAFKISTGRSSSFRLGAGISYNHKSDPDRNYSTYSNMIDPRYGYVYANSEIPFKTYEKYINLKANAWFESKQFFSGLTVTNIHQKYFGTQEAPPGFILEQLPVTYHLTAGYEIPLSGVLSTTPALQIEKTKTMDAAITPSLFFIYREKYMIGFAYSNLNSASFSAAVNLFKKYSLAVRSDFPLKEELKQLSQVRYAEVALRILI